jgi:hypothetical protein
MAIDLTVGEQAEQVRRKQWVTDSRRAAKLGMSVERFRERRHAAIENIRASFMGFSMSMERMIR